MSVRRPSRTATERSCLRLQGVRCQSERACRAEADGERSRSVRRDAPADGLRVGLGALLELGVRREDELADAVLGRGISDRP